MSTDLFFFLHPFENEVNALAILHSRQMRSEGLVLKILGHPGHGRLKNKDKSTGLLLCS